MKIHDSQKSKRSYLMSDYLLQDQHYNDDIKFHIVKRAINRADSNRVTDEVMNSLNEFGHQVGGKSEGKAPILMFSKNVILKPTPCQQRGFREIEFYEALKEALAYKMHASEEKDKFNIREYHDLHLLRELANFTVDYHGITSIPQRTHKDSSNFNLLPVNTHIILSDISRIFHRPNIVDLKIGRKTYEPDASPEKIRSQTLKYPEQDKYGFRIVGMQIYNPWDQAADARGYQILNKEMCRQIKDDSSIMKILHSFFSTSDIMQKSKKDELRGLVIDIIRKLQTLDEWFHRNEFYAFIASSILLVIEGDTERLRRDSFDLKVIDFAHVRHHNAKDYNFMYGLSTLVSFLENILKTSLE